MQAEKIRRYRIAVLPGDGIGTEVMEEAIKVLRAVESVLDGIEFSLQELPAGAAEYQRSGDALPEETLEGCRRAHATLLGAMGLPEVRGPEGLELTPQLDLREQFDLYCGLRPVRLFHSEHTPLKNRAAGQIDLLIVRENTEGLFSTRKNPVPAGAHRVTDSMVISRTRSERLFRAAFQQALQRKRRIALVDKANVLPSMVFFRRIFQEIAEEFPDVQTEMIYIDAACLYLVRRPETFDVVVTENMFGDILSDLTAALVGGMGMAPSADIGEEHGVFQPAHGTAPDIAGHGIANPTATILSVAMMLEWLRDAETIRGARLIERAVEKVLGRSEMATPDLGGSLTTQALGDAIAEALTIPTGV